MASPCISDYNSKFEPATIVIHVANEEHNYYKNNRKTVDPAQRGDKSTIYSYLHFDIFNSAGL